MDIFLERHNEKNGVEEWKSEAHYPERATPMLGICHGVFTDRLILRYILEHFFFENGSSAPSMRLFDVEDIKK